MFGAPKPTFGGFGTGTTFGAAATTNAFGGASTGLFGASTAAPATGSIFGSAAPATGSIFGSAPTSTATTSSGFTFGGGNAASTSIFGATQNNNNAAASGGLFGQPAASTSAGFGTFGAKPATGSLFGSTGATQTTSLFGSTTTTPSTSLFGATAPQVASSGTTIKFAPVSGNDTMMKNNQQVSISTKHQCITVMKEYESKSLEELRMEDYAENRKGPQPGATTSGLFATAPTSTGGLFGSTAANKPLFGAATTTSGGGLFGTQTSTAAPTLFGGPPPAAPAGSIFGAKPAQTSTFAFPASTAPTATGAFSFGSQPASTGGLFGTQPQAGKSLFGQPTTTTSTGLFGATATPAIGAFGAKPTAQATSLFAQPAAPTATSAFSFNTTQTPSTGLFGSKPATTAPFGATPSLFGGGAATSTFGATSTAGTGIFGNTALGQTAAAKPAFNFSLGSTTTGAAPTGTSLFGGTQTGGLFGGAAAAAAKPFNFATTAAGGLSTTGSLFGGTATTNAFGAGLFGSAAPTNSMAGSVFGATGPALTTTVPANATISTSSPFGGNDADVHQIMMLVNAYPYGDSPLFKNLPSKASDPSAREQLLKPTSASAQKALLSTPNGGQKVNSRPGSKLKPTPLLTMSGAKTQIFEGFEDDELTWLKSISYTPRSSVKKLVLPKRGSSARLPGRESLEASVTANGTGDGPSASTLNVSEPSTPPADIGDFTLDETHADPPAQTVDADVETGNDPIALPTADESKTVDETDSPTNGAVVANHEGVSMNGTTILEELEESDPEPPPSPTLPAHPAGIQLTRAEYYTIPSLEELGRMTDLDGVCRVENLTIGREGYGSVFFPGETDLTGLNLDEIIFFRRQEVQVYVDEENKPEIGSGINKPAEVTLDSVYPCDKTTREKITDPERLSLMGFSTRLEKASIKLGAKFMEYRPETGSWVFAVKHFSKYGFDDSDDEDDVPMAGVVEGGKSSTTSIPPKQPPAKSSVNITAASVSSAHLGAGDAPVAVGLGGVDMSALAARGEVLVNSSVGLSGLGGVERPNLDEAPEDDDDVDVADESTPARRLASHVGADNSRVQLMKASFFGCAEEDEESMVTEMTQPVVARPLVASRLRRAPLTGILNLPPPAKSLRLGQPATTEIESVQEELSADAPILENHPLLPSGMTESSSFEREAAGIRTIHPLVPEEESLTHGRQHLLLDASFFMGRSFRVGWGPAWTLVHAASPSAVSDAASSRLPSCEAAHSTASFPVTISALRAADHVTGEEPAVARALEAALKVQLEESELVPAPTVASCPEFRPKEGLELIHGQARLVSESIENSHPSDVKAAKCAKRIWELLVALYGRLPDSLCPSGASIEPGSYAYHLARRSTFSTWLASNASCAAESTAGSDVACVWTHLRAHRVTEAVNEAQRIGDYRLSLIIAQIGGCGVPKSIIRQQMADWAANGSDAFFQTDRLKILALAAGCLPWQTSVALINPCEDVDWITALALHLWYVCSATSGVSDAIGLYQTAFVGDAAYAQPPLPAYLAGSESSLDALDTCFLLMKLFQDKSSVKLERLLAPVSHTPLALDSRLSWFLSQALRSLSYAHLSSCSRALLNLDFATLLESLGMWHWAIFVLQHNPDATARDHAVKAILQRYLALEEDPDTEQFLVERLGIPTLWIHAAKAMRADHEGKRSLQAFHLLKCRSWNASHEVLLKHLASRAIVNGKYDSIYDLLAEMNVPERSSAIFDWAIGGQIIFDFIWLRKNLDSDGDRPKSEAHGPRITSLCNRISHLKCVTSYDRLAQVEMARHCSRYLKSLINERHKGTSSAMGVDAVASILPSLSCLPLPENHAMTELNQLTRQFLLQIA